MAGARARLEVLTGKAAGMSLVLDDELVIGRLAEGAGRLADDEEISRSHARLSVDARGLCTVEDLGSTNGTWVNGLRIATPQSLSEGDTVELGGTTMVVREISGAEEAPPPPAGGPPPPVAAPPASEPAAPPASEPAAPPASEPAAPPAPEPPPAPPAAAPDASEDEAGEPPTARLPGPGPEVPAPAAAEAEPAPLAAAEPAPPPPPAPPAEVAESAPPEASTRLPSTLSMKLEIDFDGLEVQISLDEATEPVRLVFDGDSWHPAPSLSTEKGDPA